MADSTEEFHRSIGIPAIKDDILYVADFSGLFHCLDSKSGKVHWTHDMFAACWGSALVVGEPIKLIDMGNSVYMTPIVANNVLYIANRNHLFAIMEEEG